MYYEETYSSAQCDTGIIYYKDFTRLCLHGIRGSKPELKIEPQRDSSSCWRGKSCCKCHTANQPIRHTYSLSWSWWNITTVLCSTSAPCWSYNTSSWRRTIRKDPWMVEQHQSQVFEAAKKWCTLMMRSSSTCPGMHRPTVLFIPPRRQGQTNRLHVTITVISRVGLFQAREGGIDSFVKTKELVVDLRRTPVSIQGVDIVEVY